MYGYRREDAKTTSKAPVYIPLRIGYECGLRLGETFGLTWEDIDFEKKTLSVNRQVQWQEDFDRSENEKLRTNGTAECGKGYWYFTTPKCSSYRVIELSDSLMEVLERELHRQKTSREYYAEYYTYYYTDFKMTHDGREPRNPIIKNRISEDGKYPLHLMMIRDNGTYITPRVMQNASMYIKKHIIEDFDYHSLRHTHASMLCEKGMNIKYIQKRLGHSDMSVTMNIYEHLTDGMREQGRKQINEMFPKEKTGQEEAAEMDENGITKEQLLELVLALADDKSTGEIYKLLKNIKEGT